jgi:hypothetical protein
VGQREIVSGDVVDRNYTIGETEQKIVVFQDVELEDWFLAEVLIILQQLKFHSSIWCGLKTVLEQMSLSE